MTCADDADGHAQLHFRWQLQQAKGVGHLRPRSADAGGQFILGAAEVLQQLLIGGSLLQGVEVRPVQVLQQGIAQQGIILGLPDDRRDHRQARQPARPPPALSSDQLVA